MTQCYHCQEIISQDVDLSVEVQGEAKAVCCVGCQAVAQAILAGGFEQYYQFRTEAASKADSNTTEQFTQYDSSSIQQEFVIHHGQEAIADIAIDGIHCAACAWLIEKRLALLDGVKQINVNSSSHRAKVSWQIDKVNLSDIFTAIAQIGYTPFPFKLNEQEGKFKQKNKAFLKRIAVSGLFTMQIMMLAFALYSGVLEPGFEYFFRWISLILTLPIVAYSGYPIIQSAIRALFNRTVNMDVPVTLAIFGIFIASVYATATGGGEVYYESVAMFIMLLLIGRYLEHNVKSKAAEISANMLKLIPLVACKKLQGQLVDVSARSLEAGDVIIVKEGTAVPADGILLSDYAQIDESMLTGESLPVSKKPGDGVFAGSILSQNTVEIRVNKAGNATTLSQMANAEADKSEQDSRFKSITDSVSQYFVSAVLGLSVVTFTGWTLAGENGFWPMIAVLVATCPCALALAMPTAMTALTSALKRQGILVNRNAALEKLPQLTTLAFDKTGTLSQNQFEIAHIKCFSGCVEQHALQLAAALERYSSHPLASAFRQTESDFQVTNIEVVPGFGVKGTIDGTIYQIGSLDWLEAGFDLTRIKGARFVLTANNEQSQQVLAAFWLQDQLKPQAKTLLSALSVSSIILSGDKAESVAAVANELEVSYQANLKPEDKVKAVQTLQDAKQLIGMVGDGINDAMVLKQADVSVAVSNAADLSKQQADIILLGDDLQKIEHLFGYTAKLNRIIKQNFAWAIGYNSLALPLAMSGILTPYAAVIGMSLSSLLVVTNSMRLLKIAKLKQPNG